MHFPFLSRLGLDAPDLPRQSPMPSCQKSRQPSRLLRVLILSFVLPLSCVLWFRGLHTLGVS
jgi:hypothetical protein